MPIDCRLFFSNIQTPDKGILVNNRLSVYPNPAQDELMVEYKAPIAGQVCIALNDITGKVIFGNTYYSTPNVFNEFNKVINYYHISAGIYMLSVQSGSLLRTRKVVVQ